MLDLNSLRPNFTVADMPSGEAMAYLTEAGALSRSFKPPDRVIASHAISGSLRNPNHLVGATGLEVIRNLVSLELSEPAFAAKSGAQEVDVEWETETGIVHIDVCENADLPALPTPTTDDLILKNVVRELTHGSQSEDFENARDSVQVLAVLAHDSTFTAEARQALGRAGAYSHYVKVAGLALDSLRDILKREGNAPGLDPNDLYGPTGSALIAVNAIGQHQEWAVRHRAKDILARFGRVNADHAPILRLLAKATRSELTPSGRLSFA
jgi:hypothetical protein